MRIYLELFFEFLPLFSQIVELEVLHFLGGEQCVLGGPALGGCDRLPLFEGVADAEDILAVGLGTHLRVYVSYFIYFYEANSRIRDNPGSTKLAPNSLFAD